MRTLFRQILTYPAPLAMGAVVFCLQTTPQFARAENSVARIKESIDLAAEPGKAYQLEWRRAGGDWTREAKVYFASSHTLSVGCPKMAGHSDCEYQLTEVPGASGNAPVSLRQREIRLVNSAGDSTTLTILSNSKAILSRDVDKRWSVNFAYVRTSENSGKLTFEVAGTAEDWTLQFGQEHVGTAILRKTHENGLTDESKVGFYLGKPQAKPLSQPSKLPTSPVGKDFGLMEHGTLKLLRFEAETVRIFTSTGVPLTGNLNYSYELTSDTHATLDLDGNTPRSYHFRVGGDGTGTFTAEVPGNGNVPLDGGLVLPPAQDNTPATTEEPCEAPATLVNRKLKLTNIVSAPVTFEFGVDTGAGQRNEDGSAEVSHFDYSYQRVDEDEAQIRTSFPTATGDQVEEIDMQFNGEDDCAGEFTRRTYTNGELTGTTTGTFGPA